MAKYDQAFKLGVVQQYLSGQDGFKQLAQRFGVSRGQIQIWVSAYELHGQAGLASRGASYTSEFKRAVLERMGQEQWSFRQTAAFFDIRSPGHISRWQGQYHEGGLAAMVRKPRGRPKKMTDPDTTPPTPGPELEADTRTPEELRKEIAYLRAEVAYLKKLRALRQQREQAAQKKRGPFSI